MTKAEVRISNIELCARAFTLEVFRNDREALPMGWELKIEDNTSRGGGGEEWTFSKYFTVV